VKSRVANALRNAGQTLTRGNSYPGARYRHLKARPGGLKAVKAMARYLACLLCRLLTKGPAWVDRGAACYENMRQERELPHTTPQSRRQGIETRTRGVNPIENRKPNAP